MIKENCEHCNNTVAGEFTPSATRKWLTALAKKGGMKAVLSTAGSVIPGFGTTAGFITGTAIDLLYGKDIDKLVDYVADQFDDNKIYVFTCPNCGHTWSRKEECDLDLESEEIDTESDETFIYEFENIEAEIESYFNEAKKYHILFNQFYINAKAGLELAQSTCDSLESLASQTQDEDIQANLLSTIDDIHGKVLELIRHIAYYCTGSQDSEFELYDGDELKSLSVKVYGAYPMIYQPNILLICGIKTGKVSLDTQITLPNGTKTKVEGVYMFNRQLGEAEAGDVCALIIPEKGRNHKEEVCSLEFPDGIFEIIGNPEDEKILLLLY